MNKKHFVVFRDEKGKLHESTNVEFRKKYTNLFDKKPKTPVNADQQLVSKHGFTLISDEEKIICFNLFNNIKKI
uniref:hypothetical protein n=1 Tax=Gelidibacter sp. TaxID=2018083 RepID=UPI00404ACAA5